MVEVEVTLKSCGKPISTAPNRLGVLRRSDDVANDLPALRSRWDQDGYLYLPGFLNCEDVRAARLAVLSALAEEGLLDPSLPFESGIPKQGVKLGLRSDVANGPEVHSLLYSDHVMDFYSKLLGGETRHYDYTWLRTITPGPGTPPHYDIVYMGRGTQQICTAWIPLGDISIDLGGLMILENSHHLEELRSGYGQMDIDRVCENKADVRVMNDLGFPSFGAYSVDPVEVAERFDRRWLTNEFTMGDLLTFSMFTMHGSLDNQGREIRLSTDSRYQLASEAVDERWIGEHPIAHGPEAKIGMIC